MAVIYWVHDLVTAIYGKWTTERNERVYGAYAGTNDRYECARTKL